MKQKNQKLNKTIVAGLLTVMTISGISIQNMCNAEENTANTSVQQAVKSLDMDEYIMETRRKIKNNWYPPVESFENTATIVLTINRDGSLQKCYLSEPSPDEKFNESLIEAAKKGVYSPLPKEYPHATADLDFVFSMQRRYVSK